MHYQWRTVAVLLAAFALTAAACAADTAQEAPTDTATEPTEPAGPVTDAPTGATAAAGTVGGAAGELAAEGSLSGTIQIDGSSTVAPLTDAIAEEYNAVQPDVTVNVGVSGTGGGFERFCGEGSTDISDASRPIRDDEAQLCEDNGIDYVEVRVGTDALTMVTNPQTEFLDCLTTDEIVTLWGPDAATSWDQVNPEFPAEPIAIFAPDTDSGTYDFFNETILEPAEIEQPRQDYNASADDNIIAQGIEGTPNSWGYFGFAYFVNNAEQLKDVAYDAGDGCVEPSVETAQDDSYKLTRPLFIYVKLQSVQEKQQVADFVRFYLDTVGDVISDVGYIEAPAEPIEESRAAIEDAISGG